jgi:hypothetical protein
MRTLALLAVFLLAGCGSPAIDQQDAIDRTIAPAGTHSVRVQLDDGKRVEWSWTADESLHFEVQDSSGGRLLAKDAAQDSGQFTATQDGTYTLVWQNRGLSSVDVRYSLRAYGKILD